MPLLFSPCWDLKLSASYLIFCCLPVLSDSRVPLLGFIVKFGSTLCRQGFYFHLKSSLLLLLWVMGQFWKSLGFLVHFFSYTPVHPTSAFAPNSRKCPLHYSLIPPLPEQDFRGRKDFLSSALQWIHPHRGCFWQNSHLFVCHTVIFGSATTRLACISSEGLGLK